MYFNILTNDEAEQAEVLSFKVLPLKFIDNSLKSEAIYFGCADKYISEYKKSKKYGQGDKNEGLFARVNKDNLLKIREYRTSYGSNLIEEMGDDFVDFKLKSVINIPTYCFYSKNVVETSVSKETNERIYEFVIPEKLFQDFSIDGFGIMTFLNWRFLYNRVNVALVHQGYSPIKQPRRITYVDRENEEWSCCEPHPNELFYKDKIFDYQEEVRMIVEDPQVNLTNKKKSQDKIFPLNIGDMSGLIEKHYPIEKTGNIRIVIRAPIIPLV